MNSTWAPARPYVNKVRETSPILLPRYIWSPDLLSPNALFQKKCIWVSRGYEPVLSLIPTHTHSWELPSGTGSEDGNKLWLHYGICKAMTQKQKHRTEVEYSIEKQQSVSKTRLGKTYKHLPFGSLLLSQGNFNSAWFPSLALCPDAGGLNQEAPLRFTILTDLIWEFPCSSRAAKVTWQQRSRGSAIMLFRKQLLYCCGSVTLVEISLFVLFFFSLGPEMIWSYQIVLWPHLQKHIFFFLKVLLPKGMRMCICTVSTFLSSENNFPSHSNRSRSGMEYHLETVSWSYL